MAAIGNKVRLWLWGHRAPLSVFGVAVGMRLLYAWILLPWAAAAFNFDTAPGTDGYYHIADCLLQGAGFRFRPDFGETMFRLPGYPLFLCALWWLFGPTLWVVQAVQALIGGCTSLLIFHLGKRYFGWLVGLLAGLAFAFWPIDWTVCARYVTEPLYVFLLVLSLVLLLRLIERPRIGPAVVLGLIMGFASLVREVNVLLIPLLAAVVPLLPPAKGRRLKCVAALAATVMIAALVMLPWIVRGYRLTGSLVLPTTGGGVGLMYTTSLSKHPDYQGDLRDHARKVLWPEAKEVLFSHGIAENSGDYDSTYWWTFMSIKDEVRANLVLKEKALEEIRSDPMRFLRTVVGNALGFWFRGTTVSMSWLARLLFAPLLLMGATGFVASVRTGQKAAWVLLLLIAALNLVCAPTVAFVRYTLPATPALLLLAARGLTCLVPWLRGHENPDTSTAQESGARAVIH